MARGLEAADIFRRHGEAFRQTLGDHLGYVERRRIERSREVLSRYGESVIGGGGLAT